MFHWCRCFALGDSSPQLITLGEKMARKVTLLVENGQPESSEIPTAAWPLWTVCVHMESLSWASVCLFWMLLKVKRVPTPLKVLGKISF